ESLSRRPVVEECADLVSCPGACDLLPPVRPHERAADVANAQAGSGLGKLGHASADEGMVATLIPGPLITGPELNRDRVPDAGGVDGSAFGERLDEHRADCVCVAKICDKCAV